MKFPHTDKMWKEVLDFLEFHNYLEFTTLAPVEFCAQLLKSTPYEWSYWKGINEFDCLILHKGMLDRLKDNYLKDFKTDFDYIYGNAVFVVLIKKNLNSVRLTGVPNHFNLNVNSSIEKKVVTKKNVMNILLVTANNNGNIGDDAITYAAFDMILEIYPKAHIIIDKAPASKSIISQVDMLIIGGGGIFYDNDFYNAQNYCQYFLYAHEAGVKSCAIGIGALGRRTTLGNELFKKALNLTEFIVVRDKESKKSLVETIRTTSAVIIKQDIAFTLKPKGNYLLKRSTNKPVLLFSLTDASNKKNFENYHHAQKQCMQMLVKHFEVKLLVQSQDDLSFYKDLQNIFKLDIIVLKFKDIKKIISLYQQSDLVITARLHSLIFSALAHVPIITISTERNASKLDILINDSLPSARQGHINMHNYSIEALNAKVIDYFVDKSKYIVSSDEVKNCCSIAQSTKDQLSNF